MLKSLFRFWILPASAILCWTHGAIAQSDAGWPNYGNDPGGSRYSAARQIDRTNVAQLKPAWTYRTGALEQQTDLIEKAAFETTPILVENQLFLSTPYNHVIALNPETGVRLWEFDPHVDLSHGYSEVSSRGVSAWIDTKAKPGQPCRLRIFIGTLDGRLIGVDGKTGQPCVDFGAKGEVDLTQDAATATEWNGGYQVTSAPAIAGDLVITGSSIADNWKVDTGRGIVRAFDVKDWETALDVEPDTLGGQDRTAHRRRQRLVDPFGRPQRRSGVYPCRQFRSGLLRWHPQGRR